MVILLLVLAFFRLILLVDLGITAYPGSIGLVIEAPSSSFTVLKACHAVFVGYCDN